ncbi:hypothetical protein MIND_01074300 [Mycena indigotica]|uniref:Vacuolar import and degradation protein 21 n=1 Tax=Mycena indigotica TaxID=2126181 RepID=A0A8H6VVD4_9AGAR|nr:uncharacterized protein MIND_01074300 [Mycena indigotica]KAF7295349.1 hypothetical protein MIND_01074300 [Mycena indigotica]
MDDASRDALVEDRIAQLQVIAERRNALLRQMYYMVHRRQTMGAVIRMEEQADDDDGLVAFLDQFNLEKHPETGFIKNFDHQQFKSFSALDKDKSEPLPSPLSQRPITPAVPLSESDDELDLIGTPNANQSRASSIAQRPASEEKFIVVQRVGAQEPERVAIIAEGDTTEDDGEQMQQDVVHQQLPIIVEQAGEVPEPNEGDEKEGLPPDNVAAEEATKPDVASTRVVDESPNESSEMVVDQNLISAQGELTPQPQPTPELLESPTEPPLVAPEIDKAKQEQDVAMSEATPTLKHASPLPQTPSSDDGESMVIDDDEDDEEVAKAVQQSSPLPPPASSLPEPEPQPKSDPVVASPVAVPPPTPEKVATPVPQQIAAVTPREEPPAIRAPSIVASLKLEEKPTLLAMQPQPNTFDTNYTLPPLKIMPADFSRKTKPGKQQRKHKDKNGATIKDKDDWAPMGISRWGALLRANPIHPKLARATKCLSSRDWSVAMQELRLIRALEQVETLKDASRWSFRQPKKQRGVGGITKTHWDYLLDEMKWMRTDFREERKWKIALAYHLSTAVLEWHCFTSQAERVAHGICVGWRRPKVDQTEHMSTLEIEDPLALEDEPMDISIEEDEGTMITADTPAPTTSLLAVDYGSDDDEDDEQEKQSVLDALEPTSALEDALDVAEKPVASDSGFDTEFKRPVSEDAGPTSLSQEADNMDIDQKPIIKKEEVDDATQSFGLKDSSINPTLSQTDSLKAAGEPTSFLAEPVIKPSSKHNIYAPLRDYLTYSEPEKLFIDSQDVANIMKDASAEGGAFDAAALFPKDLSQIFPDLPPLAMLDVAPGPADGRPRRSEKRVDRDDANKRIEETMHTKLYPIGKFMHSKPTLLGALQPAKRWKNGQWIPAEDCPAYDVETPPVKMHDSLSGELPVTFQLGTDIPFLVELFNAKFTIPPKSVWLEQQKEKESKEREAREREARENKESFDFKDAQRRASSHIWTTVDDNVLRSLVDKYPNNWPLIAECYNSAHVSISTDTRTARDCHDRWKELAARPPEPSRADDPPRGIKRLASASISGPSPVASGSDAKKRRRHHVIVDSMRKVGKRRQEQAQKSLNNQRKASVVHETHAQYTRLAKYSPAELSRMKTEKEQDINARRKQDEMARAQAAQQQQQRSAATPVAQVQPAPQQPQGSPVPQAAQPVPTPQPPPQPTPSSSQTPVAQPPVIQAQTPQQQQAILQAAQAQHQQRLQQMAARNGIPIAQQQRVASPARIPLTPQQQQVMHMRQQAAAVQQTMIQQQQALIAQQQAAGARAATSSPRPVVAAVPNGMQQQRHYGLGNYTSEQITQMLQMASQQQQQQLQRQQ